MDSRQPHSHDQAPSNTNPNIFDDEYAVENSSDLDGEFAVADGFRPTAQTHPDPGPTSVASRTSAALDHRWSRQSSVRHSISENFPAETKNPSGPGSSSVQPRSSISKGGHAPPTSTAVPDEGPNTPVAERSQPDSPAGQRAAVPLQHRISIASTSSFATVQNSSSPYAAASSGPSHPYGMYPQGTGLTRSLSTSTTATARTPGRSSVAGQGPQHPYAMYQQNVVDDPDEIQSAPAVPDPITVGFPGLGAGFHRQIGPDGEEQDIIGPDGHMEQLPPYSRFPEEGPTKASLLAVPEEFAMYETETPAAGGAAAAGASGVAGAAANPSVEALVGNNATTNRAVTNGPHEPQNGQGQTGSDASSTVTENERRPWSEKTWDEKKKTKILWGRVPLWLLIIALVIILILAIVLGAVIGTLVAKEKMADKKHQYQNPSAVLTSRIDATPIPTPTNLPALPLGKFALPIRSPDVSSNECLSISDQNDAWSCDMEGAPMEINVQNPSTKGLAAWMNPLRNSSGFNYGSQVPKIAPILLDLVEDLDSPSDGPAWHFQTLYDKIVILRHEDLNVNSASNNNKNKVKRQNSPPWATGSFQMPPGFLHRGQVVAGETPWLCIWNQTFLETFFYVERNSTAAQATPAATTPSPSATSPSVSTSYPSPTSVEPSTTTVFETSPTVTAYQKRGSPGSTGPSGASSTDDPDDLTCYPRLVKLEERRMVTNTAPYCQKMQLLDDGQLVIWHDSNGDVLTIELSENEDNHNHGSGSGSGSGSSSSKRSLTKRNSVGTSCHCQWTYS
ncbi:hypothetical protein IWX90DRAFT_413129 [Phyllosticta citrichinensis]|uniref:DUF7820 domain-containing protein n=1 Tax=Phyllosticta citrichinensis TaxID=1130410 RepID=A0ABR1XZJ0_9PEZI